MNTIDNEERSRIVLVVWVLMCLFVIVACKGNRNEIPDSVGTDSGLTSGKDAAAKVLFTEFSCRENKIQIFDDSADGETFVKSRILANNKKFAIISQTYYESEGGLIIEKDYCTQLSYSGKLVGGFSKRFLAFLANNPTEEPNGIQIFTTDYFLFESLRDVTAAMYPDSAFWSDDTTLISIYQSEEDQKIEMIKKYRFQSGVWVVALEVGSSNNKEKK